MGIKKFADRGIALGNPGAVVEQLRGVEERLQVDLHRGAAHVFERLDARAEYFFAFGVAEELQAGRLRHAEAEFRSRPEIKTVGLRRTRERIPGIELRRDGEHALRVFGNQRKNRDRIQRTAGRHDAARRQQPERRLVPYQIIERRRHPPRTGGIRAQ